MSAARIAGAAIAFVAQAIRQASSPSGDVPNASAISNAPTRFIISQYSVPCRNAGARRGPSSSAGSFGDAGRAYTDAALPRWFADRARHLITQDADAPAHMPTKPRGMSHCSDALADEETLLLALGARRYHTARTCKNEGMPPAVEPRRNDAQRGRSAS